MTEDRQNSEANVTPPANDEPTMLETSGTAATKTRPTGLLIGGFIIAAILIISGIFLALNGGDDTAVDTAPTTPAETEVANTNAIPGEIALQLDPGASPVTLASLTGTDLASSDSYAAAANAMPANRSLVGNVYALTYDGTAPNGQAAVVIPGGVTDINMLDLQGWTGSEWVFIPSQLDNANNQIVSSAVPLPQMIAVMETAAPDAPTVAATLGSDQELAVDLLPYLTVVAIGDMALNADGTLTDEMATMPQGAYLQLLRATSVDQAAINNLLADSAAQSTLIGQLVQAAQDGGYAGINADYQAITTANRDAYTNFIANLAASLETNGLTLAVTLPPATPQSASWNTGAFDWVALGQQADIIMLQLPLDPAAYTEGGYADQMLTWASRQIDRSKTVATVNASAVAKMGDSFMAMSNEDALSNFGELQIIDDRTEIEPGTGIELALSGTASPLTWDGGSLTYQYSYESDGQTFDIWLGNPAALANRLQVAHSHNLGGVAINGLGQTSDGAGYAAAIQNFLGTAEAPQPAGAAIVWTITDESGSVLASGSGEDLTFAWDGSDTPGTYTVKVEFALGDSIATLGTADVAVAEPEPVVEEEPEEVAEEPETAEPTTPNLSVGDADAVVNSNANVRLGPGLGYGLIAGGANAGTRVQVIGRNSDSSWLNIILPAGQEGWIFAQLLTLNDSVDVAALEVVEVAAAAAPAGGSGSGNGTTTAAPAPVVAPVGNANFELGGQIFGAPYGLMSYAGMRWVKRQIKWSPGTSPDVAVGMINEAHNAGFKILLSIPGQVYPSSLPDFGAYTEFLRGVAALADPPDAIEIWNEMNIDAEWPVGQINPSMYVNQMLAPAYNAIKGANSNVLVISGAPAPTGFFGGGCSPNGCDDAAYMQGMAAAGAASYMDCIGIHYNEGIISPNQRSGDPRSEHYTRYFWGMVDAYYNAFGGSRQLCFTELGYLTPEGYGGLPGNFAWAANTTVAQQAQWLAEAASLSASSGKVRMLIVWNMDSTTWGSDPQAGFAVIRPGGGCPACESLRAVMGQ